MAVDADEFDLRTLAEKVISESRTSDVHEQARQLRQQIPEEHLGDALHDMLVTLLLADDDDESLSD